MLITKTSLYCFKGTSILLCQCYFSSEILSKPTITIAVLRNNRDRCVFVVPVKKPYLYT